MKSTTVNLSLKSAVLTKVLDAGIFRIVIKFSATVCSDSKFGIPNWEKRHSIFKPVLVFKMIKWGKGGITVKQTRNLIVIPNNIN